MKIFRHLYKIAYTLGVLALLTSVLLNAGLGTALAASPQADVEQEPQYSIDVKPEDKHVCKSNEGSHEVTITVNGPPGAKVGVKINWYVVHPSSHPQSGDHIIEHRDKTLDSEGKLTIKHDLYWPGTSKYDEVILSNGDKAYIVENHLSAELYVEGDDGWYRFGYDDVDIYSYKNRCSPPTATPVPPTPTPVTPTPDPINLSLHTTKCDFIQGDSGLLWHWRVNNPQNHDVTYNVKVGGSTVLSNQTAPPGNSYFYLEKGNKDKTVVIQWTNEYNNPATNSAQQGWSYCMSLSDKCIDENGNMSFKVNNWTPAEDMPSSGGAPYDVFRDGSPAGSLEAPLGNSTFKMPSVPGSTVQIKFYNNQAKSIVESDEVCPQEPKPKVKIYDPCSVNCDALVVKSTVENIGDATAHNLTWNAYFSLQTDPVASGSIGSLDAGKKAQISFPSAGNGAYTINVYHNGSLVSVAKCDSACYSNVTPTPGQPNDVPTPVPTPIPSPVPVEDEDPLLIPVTGLDYTPTALAGTFQNLGFGLMAVGMMLHGISLRKKDE